jgi:proteasome accessory factor C
VSEQELLDDLELLFLCGVHPFTPDVLIEVDVDGGRVWIRFADYFRRPLRLSPPEGLALLSAGSTLLAASGAGAAGHAHPGPEGALARAVSKLESVLGVDSEGAVEVELAPTPPGILETVRDASESRRKLEIDYYSFGRDGSSTRVVQPWLVFNAAGQWYLRGWCEMAGGERLFRVDRISRACALDDGFPPVDTAVASRTLFEPDASDPVIVLDLDPEARWVAEQYPAESVEEMGGGQVRVSLRTSNPAWLERLLLRAGPHATIVEGDPEVRRRAAARVLARYEQQRLDRAHHRHRKSDAI